MKKGSSEKTLCLPVLMSTYLHVGCRLHSRERNCCDSARSTPGGLADRRSFSPTAVRLPPPTVPILARKGWMAEPSPQGRKKKQALKNIEAKGVVVEKACELGSDEDVIVKQLGFLPRNVHSIAARGESGAMCGASSWISLTEVQAGFNGK